MVWPERHQASWRPGLNSGPHCSKDSSAVQPVCVLGLLDAPFVDPSVAVQGLVRRSLEIWVVGLGWMCHSQKNLWREAAEAVGRRMTRVCGMRQKMGVSYRRTSAKY